MRPMRWLRFAMFASFAACLTAIAAEPARETRLAPAAIASAERLRDRAVGDATAWNLVESLTTEVGPRMAGSEADARAVAWAQAKFKALGYDRVWTQAVTFPKWLRRSESARVLGANAQTLAVTALGGSVGGTVQGEVVRFADLAALEAAGPGSLSGKLAFIDYRMERKADGSGYSPASRGRSRGPSAAIRAGAVGYVMRSVGTDSHRLPHTGNTRYDPGLRPIPAAALAAPDADQLARLIARGPVRLQLQLDCGFEGTATSYNVIGEVLGSQGLRHGAGAAPHDMVLIGGHLDSWDLGTGAVDDAAGVAITMAAGHLIARLPRRQRPARSIRVVAFANEEQGLYGAKAYAVEHGSGLHRIAAESDFGAGRIYAITGNIPPHAQAAWTAIAGVLAPLGIVAQPYAGEGGPGPDIGPLAERGAAWASLRQDGRDYFDLHHSADDTLDKIDPAALAQNVAAYAAFAYLAASAEGDFGSTVKAAPTPK